MALSNSNKGWTKSLIVVCAFLECLLFAGSLYGWSSLVFIYKQEGIFYHLCELTPAVENDSDTFDNQTSVNISKVTNDLSVREYTDLANVDILSIGRNTTEGNITNSYYHNTTDGSDALADTHTDGQSQCKAQDSMLSLCFTIGSSIFCISCVVMGHVNYKLGTRITRYIAFVIFTAGTLCLAFVSKAVPWLMFPGLTLIGVGGLPLFVTNTQVANLFTTGSSSIVGLLCGGYDSSAAVFLMIKIAHQHGFTMQNMFFVLLGLHCLTLVSTRMFLPKTFIPQRSMKGRSDLEMSVEKPDTKTRENLLVQEPGSSRRRRRSIADIQPLGSYLRQPLFITHNVWLCLLHLRFYYFIGNLNTFLNRTLNNDTDKVSYFTNVCFYTMLGGLLTSFLVGIVYDSQKTLFKKGKTKLYRSLMPALLPLLLASLFGILLSILVLVPSKIVLYIIFIIMTLFRSFLYSMCAAFINAIFPSQFYAVLYGTTMIVAGVFSLLQYALFSWAEAYLQAPFHVDVFLLCISVLSLGHPVFMWYCGWKEERQPMTEL